jgi:hypothetical protein
MNTMLVGQRNIYWTHERTENSLKRRLVGIEEDCQPGWRYHPVQVYASRSIHDNPIGMELRDVNLNQETVIPRLQYIYQGESSLL